MNRRKFLTGGIAAAASVSGVVAAGRIAKRYGLVPPDGGTLYGPGETLTYATQRLILRHALAREFSPSQITQPAFRNEIGPPVPAEYDAMQKNGFRDWRLKVDGLVSNPASFTLDEIRSFPAKSQITMLSCEEGWSYIGEWTGVPLSHVLHLAGTRPEAKFVVYRSIQPDWWWDSLDMAEALHPQTLLTYAMNGSDLPMQSGAPLRMRVPRQLGYKSIKFITHLTVTDSLRGYTKGSGSANGGYAWFAGV
jgi:DMSO/TMAO reductase YedYZ molybdopterin-dependent catalytic subunit